MMAITLHAENWEFVVTLVTNNALYVTRTLYAQILNEDLRVVPPIGDHEGTMSSGETRPATRRPGSPLAHLGEAMADMKAAHDRMAEAIREFDDFNVDLRETTDETAKITH